MKLKLALIAFLFAAGTAQAADPVASGLPPGFSFSEYSGTTAVGDGLVNISNVLFFIDEQTVAGIKSWYIFFEPLEAERVTATITFDSPIVNVLDTKPALDGSNATYGIDVDGDGIFDDYTTSLLIAPEGRDVTTWTVGGLTLDWISLNPGDHIRVLTQATVVPEPETWGLFAAGLAALGWRARRTSARRAARR
ncbi:MAG TPA: PEP-CTERM sorting domain-containing protein [Caldimonas sp.]|jgi:hypothetical protein